MHGVDENRKYMKLLTEQEQYDTVSAMCRSAKKRVWIASPYVGDLKSIYQIIDGKWERPGVECRVLTDIDTGIFGPDTFDRMNKCGVEIRSLRSLHAKIYIVDDECVVTSANLTGTAFLARYEMGVKLDEVSEVEAVYNRWWDMAKGVTELPPRRKSKHSEYEDPRGYKRKFTSEPYYSKQDAYDAILDEYGEFANMYFKLTGGIKEMEADGFKRYFQMDFFFSHIYQEGWLQDKKPQTEKQRNNLIISFYNKAKDFYLNNRNSQHWRLDRYETIQKHLKSLDKLDWDGLEEILGCLNTMDSLPINKTRILGHGNNELTKIRDALKALLETKRPTKRDIRKIFNGIYGFGEASATELLGWYRPEEYPIINHRPEEGLKFFRI